ncbi:hypothetical protein ALC60_04171 [Trachymyrmex zeteki]|uniref:Uncharacterized protein n=1 Tax=Mycetomoellerius zeteki TaxID=64791 RepID=A0A151X925_9HYME|nr:hypothetical protein ALC60_04171 [Trachymyrmex zeteki]
MTETLERALEPLFTFGSFCDLGMFERPLGQPRPYISCLYILAKWIFYTYYWLYPRYIYILQTVCIFTTDVLHLITIILIFVCLYRSRELKMCLRELAIIDETLEALGTPKEYQRLNNWINRIIIGWIVYVFFYTTYGVFLVFLLFGTFNFIDYLTMPFDIFLLHYPYYIIILSAMISTTILGLVHVYILTLQVYFY